jgi:hypothetical protein
VRKPDGSAPEVLFRSFSTNVLRCTPKSLAASATIPLDSANAARMSDDSMLER